MDKLNSFLTRKRNVIIAVLAAVLLVAVYCYCGWAAWFDSSDFKKPLAVIVLGVLSCIILLVLVRGTGLSSFNCRFYWAFTATFLVLGVIYMSIFMPLKSPDEQSHYAAAYRYSDVMMGLDGMNPDSFPIRSDDAEMLDFWWIDHRDLSDDYGQMVARFDLFADNETLVDYPSNIYFSFDSGSRPIQLHLFSALGITLGRIMGLGAIPTFYLGRLFNLLFFAVVAQLVLRISPIAKTAFSVVFLLPITLHLAASYSYDVPIIAMAMLIGAICLKFIFSASKVKIRDAFILTLLTLLLAPGKGLYVLVSLLAFLIPSDRFSSRKASRLFKIWIAFVVFASFFAVVFSRYFLADTGNAAPSFNSSGGVPGSDSYVPSYTLQMAIDDPLRAFMMLVGAPLFRFGTYFEGFFGGFMSWGKDLTAPLVVPLSFAAVFILSLSRGEADREGYIDRITPSMRVISVVFLVMAYLAMAVSMLISFTSSAALVAEGVQGRYFLPLAPLMIVMLYGLLPIGSSISNKAIVIGSVYLNLIYCGILIMEIMTR